MKNNPVRMVLTVILALVFLFSAGWLINRQIQYKSSGDTYSDAMKLAGLTGESKSAGNSPNSQASDGPESGSRSEEGQSAPTVTPEPTLEPAPPELSELAGIDLGALQEVNSEVVGWIAIPDTDLSYPIMAHEDNQFYLEHSWNNEYNPCGAIFLECMSSADFTDYNTIVYGHRMANDSMFGMLRFYQEDEYRQEHPSIYIVYGDELRRYDVFAAYEADVEGIVYQLNLEEKNRQQEFIDACLESSVIDTGIVPTKDDPVLTLSTCPSSGYASRLVVQGYLAERYQR